MKKILFSLAAVAAMVGCAKDAPIVDNTNNTPVETLAISASIDLSDTRVTISGEEFTDVKWAQGDRVRLVSVKGVKNTELQTTESGDTNVRFRGNADAEYVADEDTYYAVYPSTTITDGVVSFDLTTQNGNGNGKAANAAILAAKATTEKKGVIDMEFKPINALLHVAVTGAPAIKTAEFLAFDGAEFDSGFSYDFAEDKVTTTAKATVLTVNNPKADDFFFSLPAGLEMANGYIVRLTDTNNNVCSKAYSGSTINGTTFKQGTTTRVEFEWSQPTVTLGTPMTSYSYYAAGNVSQANNCANNIIYFPTASSYANVQNAMVTKAGIVVKQGSTIISDQKVAFANNSFGPAANVTVSSWGEHTVRAYIETKDGKRYESAPQTVHITGLPLTSTFIDTSSMPAYWNGGNYSFKYISSTDSGNRDKFLRLKGAKEQSGRGYLYSNEFHTPSDINAQVVLDYKAYQSSGHDYSITIKASSSSVSNSSDGEYKVDFTSTLGTNFDSISDITDNMTLTTSTPRVLITHDASTYNASTIFGDTYLATAYVGVKTITVSYR